MRCGEERFAKSSSPQAVDKGEFNRTLYKEQSLSHLR